MHIGASLGDMTEGAPAKEHLSFTQLNMFKRCGMQWYYRYILGWISPPSLPLATGKAGHQTLETNGRHKIATGNDKPVAELLDIASDSYDAHVDELTPADLKPDEDIGATKDAHLQLIRFYASDTKNGAPSINPIAVEVPFTLDLPPTEEHDFPVPPITGRIDEISNGIWDDKFVMRARTQAEVDLTPQLTLYDMAAQHAGISMPRLGYRLFIPPTKTNPPRIIPMTRSPDLMTPTARLSRIQRLDYSIRTTYRKMKAGLFDYADDPKVCASCGYRNQCQYSLVKSDYEALKIRQMGATTSG